MLRVNPLMLLLPALVSVACSPSSDKSEAPQPEIGAPEEPDLRDALASISAAHLQEHLQYLAADARKGRMPGTPGYRDAAQYVAEQFEALELQPAGKDGWYQSVPLIASRIDADTATAIIHRDEGDVALTWKKDFAMGGDHVRDETEVRGEVVFAGYGIDAPDMGYSDFSNVDVNGKIVAIFSGAPPSFPHNQRAFYSSSRTKLQGLVKRGVIGIVGLRTRVDRQRRPWERLILNAGKQPGMSWISPSGDVQDYHPEIEGRAWLNADAARRLFAEAPITFEDALDAADTGEPLSAPLGVEVTLSRDTSHEKLSSKNVVAVLRGSDPELREEYVVFSAHLDHLGTGAPVNGDNIYNGYYDNAMGVALMIEAARAFAAMPEPPRRSILFLAVTAEERGLLGSDYFAHNPTVPLDAIVADVNLDMPLLLYPVADTIAFGAEHSSLQAPIETALAAEDFVLSPDPMPEEVIFIRSDQYSFVRQGVPSVFLVPGFTSTDPDINGETLFRNFLKTYYHRPSDDSSLPVDWPSALRFARANVRIGLAVADDSERPTWNAGDFFGARFGQDRLAAPEEQSGGTTPE